jgi:hypothetical protein
MTDFFYEHDLTRKAYYACHKANCDTCALLVVDLKKERRGPKVPVGLSGREKREKIVSKQLAKEAKKAAKKTKKEVKDGKQKTLFSFF